VGFDDSALILAEVIKTLIDHGQVASRSLPGELISAAVDSPIAATLWNKEGSCEDGRVVPRHIAIVWMRTNGHMKGKPPPQWRLSPWEIHEARQYEGYARRFLESVNPVAPGVPSPALARAN